MSKGRYGERGQSTVELALCLPFVALLVTILLQVGMIAVDHVRLWHGAREAARVAAVDPDPEAIRAAALRSGVSPIEVRTDPAAEERAQGAPVEITLEHSPIVRVPLIGPLFRGVVLRAAATMRIETP